MDTVGFYIYRRTNDSNGDFFPVSGLAPSQGAGGGEYLFVDDTVEVGVAYTYLLVERRTDDMLVRYDNLIIIVGLGGLQDQVLYLPIIAQQKAPTATPTLIPTAPPDSVP